MLNIHILNPVEVTKYNYNKANSLPNFGKLFAFSVLRLTLNYSIYVSFSNFVPQLPHKLPNEF